MKKKLLEATECYEGDHNEGVYPISHVDGEIITNLLTLLKRSSSDNRIIEAVAEWKSIEDGDLLNKIIALQSEEFNTSPFLQIKDQTFNMKYIFHIRAEERWATWAYTYSQVKQYGLLINPGDSVNQRANYRDVWIAFGSEEQRDYYYKEIQKQLEEQAGIIFTKVE